MSAKKISEPSNKHIEKDANGIITRKLRALFLTRHLELGENTTTPSQDWGTDFYIEVLNKDKENKREMLFLIQCKGLNKNPKILKNENAFSFNISLRHANYFYHELSEPLIFMVCDITNDKVFWCAIQLDTQLKDRIIEQANSRIKSLQIKIPADNILNEENFEKFLSDLNESQKVQFHKKREKINLKANYDSINKSLEGLSSVEGILKFLKIFEGINVFPVSIINKFKVFTGKGGSLYGETLSTDNKELFDFLENLQVKDESFHLKNTQVDYANLADLQDKIRHVVNFFRINWISHVTWHGRSDKKRDRICVHNLFISKKCDCERCSYFKLDLPKVAEKLDIQNEPVSNEYRLRKAYAYYLISDFEKSFREHKNVIANIKINETPGLYIVAKYNLLQLKRMVDWGYFKEGRQEILKEMENETFALDEILMPAHFLDIFRRISESEFVNNAIWDIDNKLTEIQKNWRSDQFGGSSNNSHARSLIVDFLRAYSFVEYNHIIYNEYREFEVLVNKTMEGIFALYAINNPTSSKYDHFGYTIIDMWLFHAEPKHIKYLLAKYKLNSLNMEFSDIEYSRLNDYINNLINSAPIIIQNFKDENFSHTDKIKKVIQNYLLIISVINLNRTEKNLLLKNYLILIETLGEWCFTSFEYLEYFLQHNIDVDNENSEKIIIILIAHNHYSHDAFSTAIDLYTRKFENASQTEIALKKVLQIETFTAEDFCDRNKFRDLIFVVNRLTKETKDAIRKDIIAKLNEKFDDDLYYTFSIFNVLEYNELFMKNYLDLTPDNTSRKTGTEMLTGKQEMKNYHLDRGINLMFHYDVEFTPEIRALSSKAIDKNYYNWIMDIDGFDYSGFNLYWVLHYKTEAYFKAFRKSQKLKSEIITGLKEKYIEGVANILINKL
jgi:hypothetical protein